MKFPRVYSLVEIAKLIDCDFIGDDNFPVLGMNEIHVVTIGDIVFVDHPKYYDKALNSNATIILINKEVDCPDPISRIFFTLFCILVLINGSNFIDGINTLTATYYIMILGCFIYLKYNFYLNYYQT